MRFVDVLCSPEDVARPSHVLYCLVPCHCSTVSRPVQPPQLSSLDNVAVTWPSSRIQGPSSHQTLCFDELARNILSILSRLKIEHWVGHNIDIGAEVLRDVRDWGGWLSAVNVDPEGGFLGEKRGIHTYLMMFRRDLPAALRAIATASGTKTAMQAFAAHDMDIVMVTKRYASDSELSQKPVVLIPWDRFSRLQGALPSGARPRNPPKRAKHWQELADYLIETRPDTATMETVRFLKALVCETRGGQPLPDMPFHSQLVHPDQPDLDLAASFRSLCPAATFRCRIRA